MTRKRNTWTPSGSRRPPAPERVIPQTSVSINLRAAQGRDGLKVGTRVRLVGSGLYAGETAVIERLTGSVVPSAVVRTESGSTRQVRTIDLEPIDKS